MTVKSVGAVGGCQPFCQDPWLGQQLQAPFAASAFLTVVWNRLCSPGFLKRQSPCLHRPAPLPAAVPALALSSVHKHTHATKGKGIRLSLCTSAGGLCVCSCRQRASLRAHTFTPCTSTDSLHHATFEARASMRGVTQFTSQSTLRTRRWAA